MVCLRYQETSESLNIGHSEPNTHLHAFLSASVCSAILCVRMFRDFRDFRVFRVFRGSTSNHWTMKRNARCTGFVRASFSANGCLRPATQCSLCYGGLLCSVEGYSVLIGYGIDRLIKQMFHTSKSRYSDRVVTEALPVSLEKSCRQGLPRKCRLTHRLDLRLR